MSRIRTTLDSVTKAVGGTDLISKISRLKPGSSVVGAAHVDKILVKAEPPASSDTAAAMPAAESNTATKPTEQNQNKAAEEEPDKKLHPDAEKPFVANKISKSNLASMASESAATSSSTVAKQTLQLFHPAALSTNMDETYNTLAQHVNSYFGTDTHTQGEDGSSSQWQQHQQEDEKIPVDEPILNQGPQNTGEHHLHLTPVAEAKSVEPAAASPLPLPAMEKVSPPVGIPSPDSTTIEGVASSAPPPSASSKKGFTHYLSYPRPRVQAFVGSYIVPLVPKFRGDSKNITNEKDKSSPSSLEEVTMAKTGEVVESEEEKAEDKAKKLLLTQREKIIARVSVDNRTRALVKGLQRVIDIRLLTSRVEELSYHLLEFPETRGVAIKERVLPCLLRLRQARNPPLQAAVREALALVGYNDPVKGRGIRVLAIDGGGTSCLIISVVSVQVPSWRSCWGCSRSPWKNVRTCTGNWAQTSSSRMSSWEQSRWAGAMPSMTVKSGRISSKEQMIPNLFQVSPRILSRERMGEGLMVESARDPNCPKVSAVSTVVNRGLPLKAYVFRNYRLMPGVRSHYPGDCKHKLWQAIRASSAAPGYFQEFVLGKDLHQDGGLLINNPTALAIHECKCLWPNTPVQCVVSLGTGRFETGGKNSTTYTSLKTKLTNVISSATDTEEVHTMLDALLPPDTYFRFNPCMSEDIPLDESRRERLNFLKSEGERYLERNEAKLRKAASMLGQEKSVIQRLAEWAKLKANMEMLQLQFDIKMTNPIHHFFDQQPPQNAGLLKTPIAVTGFPEDGAGRVNKTR
ncbi:calcium-independent phospholipase A2-gamma isoform X2 [Lampris incognitus]|uniref:calcium-independent phospholipase A2-gamma isoform X2 n=1 Tax=Lampris incognitus TaxID=2546036 RepID=UPI0024B557EE|nr:calcium-independent phospholipase A2-gamma isoform X2 [Lampris incognitus]